MRRLDRLASLIIAIAFLGLPSLALAQATPIGGTPVAPASPVATPVASPVATPALSSNAAVFAKGLNNPRELKFGPDGSLYVAEGGTGGTTSTNGQCTQVVPPIGPYTGGDTASISRIFANGLAVKYAQNLPSSQTAAQSGSLVSGVADVAFIGNTLYALITGAGCSHGVANHPNGIYQVNADGSTSVVADLSKWYQGNPVAKPNPADFEPDETPYSMVAVDNMLYVVGPNGCQIIKVDPSTGTITRLIDISAVEGHVVPTAITVGKDGNFYVGNLGTFPVTSGKQFIYQVTPEGKISTYATGLTAVLGIAFGNDGTLYALEMSAGAPPGPAPFVPNTGRVVSVGKDGKITPVTTGLNFPSGMTLGPDGKLYVSNNGFATPPGSGEVIVISLPGSAS
jgi:glucose/arabinose dehydrogenase